MSQVTTSQDRVIVDIPTLSIDIGEQLLRQSLDEDNIAELALDIQRHGLLQPIGLYEAGGGRYQLLYGSRRLRAFKHLRKTAIPARIHDKPEGGIKSVAIRENIHRLSMTLKEECDAVQHLTAVEELSIGEISDRTGKSRNWVLTRLAIPEMDPETQDLLLNGKITIKAAEILTKIEDVTMRAYIANQLIVQSWTTRQLEECVKLLESVPDVEEAVQSGLAVKAVKSNQTNAYLHCEECGERILYAEARIQRVCWDRGMCKERQEP